MFSSPGVDREREKRGMGQKSSRHPSIGDCWHFYQTARERESWLDPSVALIILASADSQLW